MTPIGNVTCSMGPWVVFFRQDGQEGGEKRLPG